MRLTRASNYALQALAYFTEHPADKSVASHVAAEARDIPERFLLKVLQPLVSAGVLRSIKGPNGGYRLARPPRQITLLEIVEAVDGPIRGDAPAVGKDGASALDRKLQGVCDQAATIVRDRLGKVTLADMVKGK
ncbi:MAG TPA: Rrf2 family transcriptional regulator [Gemmataceae bacterium]|nr:Rrf2 family transcriptional regulator [Gemmataceae bacterium]